MIFEGLIIFLIGASIGSFAYAFALRFTRGEPWVLARSKCEKCGRVLNWSELVPVLSFLIQKGKCKKCGVFIGWKYLWPEILMGLAVVRLWAKFAFNADFSAIDFIFWISIVALFLVIALSDLEYFIIPDKILILILIFTAGFKFLNLRENFLNDLSVGALLFGLFFLIWFAVKGNSLGFGDVKLAGVIGFVFGFLPSFLILTISVFVALLVGVTLIVFKRAGPKTPLPFGFFMGLSAIFYLLFPDIVNSIYFQIESALGIF